MEPFLIIATIAILGLLLLVVRRWLCSVVCVLAGSLSHRRGGKSSSEQKAGHEPVNFVLDLPKLTELESAYRSIRPFTCPYCKIGQVHIQCHETIDVVMFPERKQWFTESYSRWAGFKYQKWESINTSSCHECRRIVSIPFVYWDEDWIGVVLGNLAVPPIRAEAAITHATTLLSRTKPPRDNLPSTAFVLGTMQELAYRIRNPNCRSYIKPLSDMLFSNRAETVDGLTSISDAFLQAEMPHFAFWVFGDTLPYMLDLYFEGRVREALELTALAAGIKLLPGQTTERTAGQQLKLIKNAAEEYKRSYLSICNHTNSLDLFYYKPIAEINDIAAMPSDDACVYQVEPSSFEKCLGRMFVFLWWYEAQRHLVPLAEIKFFGEYAQTQFCLHWPTLTAAEQHRLAELYESLMGRSLCNDLGLTVRWSARAAE
jgi:hypothetical protein